MTFSCNGNKIVATVVELEKQNTENLTKVKK